ncbi:MAG: hypothetical protein RSE32_13710 [Comamonas sp.]|uniref:hypothetical protein n=1 Tax=Comamonas sp. TaxID=34028 RepID=UPI002FCA6D92
MNADQVIEGISNAVAAAKPAQEYCLLWSDYWWWMCMTKAEWSGWMQAIGAVLAIVASALLMRHQVNIDRRAKERAAASRVRAFVTQLYATSLELKAPHVMSEPMLKMRRLMLEEWIQDSRGIEIEFVSSEWFDALHGARATAVRLIHFLQSGEKRFSEVDPGSDVRETLLRFYRHDLEVCHKELEDHKRTLDQKSALPESKICSRFWQCV